VTRSSGKGSCEVTTKASLRMLACCSSFFLPSKHASAACKPCPQHLNTHQSTHNSLLWCAQICAVRHHVWRSLLAHVEQLWQNQSAVLTLSERPEDWLHSLPLVLLLNCSCFTYSMYIMCSIDIIHSICVTSQLQICSTQPSTTGGAGST